jgi:hypothetical protein
MRILGDRGTIELTRGSFDSPADLDVCVESEHFSGRASNIFLTSEAEFFSQIRSIERENHGRAVLTGTEDFELVFELPRGNGDFLAQVRICHGLSQTPPAQVLTCRFLVSGEYWSSSVSGLRAELFLPPRAGV